MIKLTNYLLSTLAITLGLALILTLNVFLIPVLGYWMIAVNIAYILTALILVSHLFSVSIPGIKHLLKGAYYRAKYKAGGSAGLKKAGGGTRFYLQILVYLIWLFKETEEGFEVVKNEADHFYGKALLLLGSGESGRSASKKDLLHVHRRHQNRATALSLTALFVLIVGTVVTGLISSFIFPAIFQSRAATYTWTQTDWSGGTSTDVVQHGTSDTDNWTKFMEKDSNISITDVNSDGEGEITMESGSEELVDDTDEDFGAGTSSGCLSVVNGSVTHAGYDGGDSNACWWNSVGRYSADMSSCTNCSDLECTTKVCEPNNYSVGRYAWCDNVPSGKDCVCDCGYEW